MVFGDVSSSDSPRTTRRASATHLPPQPGRERPLGPRLGPAASSRRGVVHAPAAVLEPNSAPAKNAGQHSRRLTPRPRLTRCTRDSSPTDIESQILSPYRSLRADPSVRMSDKRAPGVPRGVPRSAVSRSGRMRACFSSHCSSSNSDLICLHSRFAVDLSKTVRIGQPGGEREGIEGTNGARSPAV